MLTSSLLTIRDFSKPIPYAAAVRPEGSTCHGFKLLKWREPAAVDEIAEAADIECLRNALTKINSDQSAFFTIGCEKALNKHEETFWAKGYLEFAFNYKELAGDAQWYFKIFFEFHRYIVSNNMAIPAEFIWELDGAHFTVANFMGYSAAIWITTSDLPTAEEAKEVWCAAVDHLGDFLASIPARGTTYIYPPPA